MASVTMRASARTGRVAMAPLLRPGLKTSTFVFASAGSLARINTRCLKTSRPRYSVAQPESYEAPPISGHGLGRPQEQGSITENTQPVANDSDGRFSDLTWSGNYIYQNSKDGLRTIGAGNIRDSCCCPLCRNPSSGQKTFSTPDVPMSPRILNVEASTDGGLKVSLDQDLVSSQHGQGHNVLLNSEYLAQQNILQSEAHPAAPPLQPVYWDRKFIEKDARFIDYDEFMQEDSAAFWDVMEDLEVLGLVFLRNVPRDDQSVVRIGEHIGNLRETFYGRTFDVRAKPNAENVAYTNEYLGLHQDLLYLDEQPHIQILHCMDNTAQGGESLFSDADRIGRMLYALRSEFPPLADLVEYKVRYAYDRNGYYYENTRPLLEEQNVGEFRTVRWSPPFQGHQPSGWKMSDWLASARVFERCVNAEDAVYERKMAPGECVLFNNLRVLHGRKSFDLGDGGKRWLRGTYLGREVFASRLHYMPKDRLRRAERSVARTVHDLLNDLSGSPDFEGLRRELRADAHIGKSKPSG